MLILLKALTALALAAWFGAMLFFSAGTAPVAFTVLGDRVLAGNVVNGAMRVLAVLTYGAAALALVSYAVRAWLEPALRMTTAIKAALVALMLAVALYSGFAVTPELAQIRHDQGAIDQLPPTAPERVRFGELHHLSVTLMGVQLLGVLAVIVLEQLGPSAAT